MPLVPEDDLALLFLAKKRTPSEQYLQISVARP